MIYPCLSSEQKIAIIKLENCNDYYQAYYDSIRPKLHEENQELRKALIINDSVKTITKEVALNNAALLKQESKENKDLKIENSTLNSKLEKADRKINRKKTINKILLGAVIVETAVLVLIFL